jgi:anti-anti-sigma factor
MAAPRMQIEFLVEGEVNIVRLIGRFVTGSDAEFLRTKEALSRSDKQKVVVDCKEVPYLDSTALNFIVGLYTSVKNTGGRLVICGLNARMSEVLRITRLDEIIPVYPDRDTALSVVADVAQYRERANER